MLLLLWYCCSYIFLLAVYIYSILPSCTTTLVLLSTILIFLLVYKLYVFVGSCVIGVVVKCCCVDRSCRCRTNCCVVQNETSNSSRVPRHVEFCATKTGHTMFASCCVNTPQSNNKPTRVEGRINQSYVVLYTSSMVPYHT